MATYTKTLVSTILQNISDLRGESATNTEARRIRAVSRAYRDFIDRKFWRFCLLADQSTVGDGTANYSIGSTTFPMRPHGLTDVRVGGTGESYRYHIVDIDTYRVEVSKDSDRYLCYEWFDATNDLWKVHLNATPAATSTIYYSYYWTAPTLTATTDYVTCPNPLIIARLAMSDIYEGEDEIEKAMESKRDAEQMIGEQWAIDNSPAVNQVIVQGNINDEGIGTY